VELQAELDDFLASTPFPVQDLSPSAVLFNVDYDDIGLGSDDEISISDCSNSDLDIDEHVSATVSYPEKALLPLPSYLGPDHISNPIIAALAKEERSLRKSQALEALHQLRISLGLKSAMFRKSIALAKSQKTKTRAWRSFLTVQAAVNLHSQEYRTAQHALLQLNTSPTVLAQFPELRKEDLKMSRDVVEENRIGQRSEHVSWIWRLDGRMIDKKSALLTESKHLFSL
jgi:hypothetical protein